MYILMRSRFLTKVVLVFSVIPAFVLLKHLITGELFYLLYFTYPIDNVRNIVDEIETYGFTLTQPYNSITEKFSVIKDPYKALCGNSSICEGFDMVYVVKSSTENFGQRMAIRKTWGTDKTIRLKTLFIVGYVEDMQRYINLESNTYQDILQFDIIDNYLNLVYKTVFSIIWLADRKIQARYVHFLDDDRLVNTRRLHQFAEKNIIETDMKMIGHRLTLSMPFRDRSSKHYISVDEYPYDFWPPYLIGGTILTNMKVVKKIALSLPYVKIIAIEDAFIGIVSKLLHIAVIHNSDFLPYFIPGNQLIYKLSSPDYKSYHVMIENWRHIRSYNVNMLN